MTKNKPQSKELADRDLHVQLRFPTLSWSSYHAFTEYDKEIWYKQYVLGERSEPNKAMGVGIEVGDKIITDKDFLPMLERPEIYEQEFTAILSGIRIRGHLDGFSPSIPAIDEFKTSASKDRWTQKKVDSWHQLTFYCALVYIHKKIPPEKLRLRLWSIPIIEKGDFSYDVGKPIMFETKRTMTQMLNFLTDLKRVHKEMLDFVESKKV